MKRSSHLSQVPWREVEGHYSPQVKDVGEFPTAYVFQLSFRRGRLSGMTRERRRQYGTPDRV